MSEQKDKAGKQLDQMKSTFKGGLDGIIESVKTSNKNNESFKNSLAAQSKSISDSLERASQVEGVNQSSLNNLQKATDQILKQFEKGSSDQKEQAAALNEIKSISKMALDFEKNPKAVITGQEIIASKLDKVVQGNERATEFLEADVRSSKISDSIKELEKVSLFGNKENTESIKRSYEIAQEKILAAQASGNQKLLAAAKKELDLVEKGVQSEEKRREAAAAQEEQNSTLLRIAKSSENMGEKLSNAGSTALKAGGFLAGIAGLFLLFTDPETLEKIITKVVIAANDIIQGIIKLFQGDFSGALKSFEGHGLALTGIFISIGLLFGGKVIAAFSALLKFTRGLMLVMRVFRVFMMGPFIGGMTAAFSGMMAAITPILAALAPILLPILAIAAAFGLVLLGLNKIKESMGFTSIFDVVEYGLAHVKDGLARFGNFFIKIAKKIADLASGVLEMFGFEVPDFITDLSNAQMLSTDNAAKKKVELKEKADQAELEKQRKEQEERNLVSPRNTEIPEVSTGMNMEQLQSESSAIKLDTQRDKPINNVNSVSANTNNNQSNIQNITYSPMSPAAYALGDLGGR